jgi:hypothetical protein
VVSVIVGSRPGGRVERVRGWLQRATAELDMPVLTARDEDAWVAYANLLRHLSTFGRQPREATERMKLLYAQVSGQSLGGTECTPILQHDPVQSPVGLNDAFLRTVSSAA